MSLRRELDREAKKKTDREKPDTKREPSFRKWTILINQNR
jgi:hypothetical protein